MYTSYIKRMLVVILLLTVLGGCNGDEKKEARSDNSPVIEPEPEIPVPEEPAPELDPAILISGSLRTHESFILNNYLFFVTGGGQLIQTNATPVGTTVVKDFEGSSIIPHAFVKLNDVTIFILNNPEHGNELWTTDGTEYGTRIVKDIILGSEGSNPSSLTKVGERVVFVAESLEHGRELWITDGTHDGTYEIADIAPNNDPFNSNSSNPKILAALGEKLIFKTDYQPNLLLSLDVNTSKIEIVFDKTVSVFSKDFYGKLYFIYGKKLWSTDGSLLGTTEVATLPLGGDSIKQDFENLYVFGNGSILQYDKNHNFISKFVDDPRLKRDMSPDHLFKDYVIQTPHKVLRGDNLAFFIVSIDGSTYEVRRTDGTESGTGRIATVKSGYVIDDWNKAFIANDKLFFQRYKSSKPYQGQVQCSQWVLFSDGSVTGTKNLLSNSYKSSGSSNCSYYYKTSLLNISPDEVFIHLGSGLYSDAGTNKILAVNDIGNIREVKSSSTCSKFSHFYENKYIFSCSNMGIFYED